MLSYSKIIKDSYRIALQNKILWVFGALVAGGFNLNFLHFADLQLEDLKRQQGFFNILNYLQIHPAKLALLSFSILAASLVSLVLINWCRVMLILLIRSILEANRDGFSQQFKASWLNLWPVIKISVLTTFAILAVAAGLLGVPLLLVSDLASRTLLWALASVIFLPLAFTVSCINSFTTYFIILFKFNLGKSLDLGTDFFLTNWNKLLALTLLLVVIYSACVASGVGLVFILSSLAKAFLIGQTEFGILKISAIMIVLRWFLGAILWLFIGGLNVFFNTASLMFFLQLITPIKKEEAAAKELAMHPVAQ